MDQNATRCIGGLANGITFDCPTGTIVNGDGKCVPSGEYGTEIVLPDNSAGFLRSAKLVGFQNPYTADSEYTLKLRTQSGNKAITGASCSAKQSGVSFQNILTPGWKTETNNIASGESVDFKFKSDGSETNTGFGVAWTTESLGRYPTDLSLYYDPYSVEQYAETDVPRSQKQYVSLTGYKVNKEYKWMFAAGNDQKICVEIRSFNIENQANCVWDYLKVVMDGVESQRYCGKFEASTVRSQE